jgi:hypothetical protein
MEFIPTSIEILGVRIDEPIATFTDVIVAAVCFYAFFILNRISKRVKLHYYLKLFFLTMGIGTFLGGVIGHGFLYFFNDITHTTLPVSPWKLPGWYASMFSIALLERAVIERSKVLVPASVGRFFSRLNIIELVTFMTITGFTLNFFFVEVHTAYGFLVVTSSFSLFIYLKTHHKGSKRFLIAVACSAISALFFMNKWSFGKWCNYFDISHSVMAVGAWFFYRGADYMMHLPIKEIEFKNRKRPFRRYSGTIKAFFSQFFNTEE